jgi:hypothetical protein
LLQALQKRITGLKARVFTTLPPTLFERAGIDYCYHRMSTDVGLVQRDAFTEDLQLTCAKLAELLPYAPSLISRAADLCRSCRLIVSDISSLGIEVGKAGNIPTLLVENFTWDWIYAQMAPDSGFEPFIELLSRSYAQADYRVQTDPVCTPVPCDLHCGPMARKQVMRPARIREELAADRRKIVLISMGGFAFDPPFIKELRHHEEYLFVIAGQSRSEIIDDNIRLLAIHSGLHHPDLINAADLLICKSGYSTIAECVQTATPICCVATERFAESEVIEHYVSQEMNGEVIERSCFLSGGWLNGLEEMMLRSREPLAHNGADQAAELILSII